jgi:hypothetical protein
MSSTYSGFTPPPELEIGHAKNVRHVDVLFMTPEFGDLSERLSAALTNLGLNRTACRSFREAAFERRGFVPLTRVLRFAAQVFPLGRRVRAILEGLICVLRFDRARSECEIMDSVKELRCRHLVIVKPMLFTPASFQRLIEQVGASEVTVVLWDALWRTPTITSLLKFANRVFTTEVEDLQYLPSCATYLGLPVRDVHSDASEMVVNEDKDSPLDTEVFFTCSAWSVDRFLVAMRLRHHIRDCGAEFQIHLVTPNRLLAWIGRFVGFNPSPMSPEQYSDATSKCSVLVDLGRVGQSSPSERLQDARRANLPLLSANASLSMIGEPIVTFVQGVSFAVWRTRALARLQPKQREVLWNLNPNLPDRFLSEFLWASVVAGLAQNSNFPGDHGNAIFCDK